MRFLRFFVLSLLFIGLSLPSNAQTTTTGGVAGVVTDSSGAVLSGATVVLTNVATDAKQDAKSSASGSYRFDLLPPGTYKLTVDQQGFERLESRLVVDSSKVVAANLKLTVGSMQQTVEVTAVAELINADDANVATTVSQTQVAEVPNSGNNLLAETRITPGFNTGFGVVGNTLYQIDGENYNDPYNNANNSGASNLTLGLNDVSEATIIANGYSGQYGGLVGATASFTTKSGANRVHGNANYYWTGRSLIANTYLHKSVVSATNPIVPRSFENANQWAAMISGPLTIPHVFNGHDKLFFLADAEGLRAILPASPVTVALPSANLETYTISKLTSLGLTNSIPFYQKMFNIYNTAAAAHNAQPGNPTYSNTTTFTNASTTGCPTASNSLSAADLTGLGLTSANGVYTGLAGACTLSYASNAITYANEALEIFRVDANLSANDKFFIRYEHDAGVQPTTIDPISPSFNAISIQPQHNGQFNETHTFGAKAVNNFILAGLWYGALFGPADLNAALSVFPGQLAFSDSSLSGLGGSNGSFPTGRNITTIQIQDDVAINEGAHTLKFGGKGYLIKENDHYFTAGTVPTLTVASLGAFINGGYDPAFVSGGTFSKATTFAQTFPPKANQPVLINQLAAYAEDNWKATRELTLSFALRLEHQGNIHCLTNCLTQLQSQFPSLNHSTTANQLSYLQAYQFNQDVVFPGLQELEWQPRIGFAYNPSFMQSIAIRGGYGIFYDGLAGSTLEGVAKNPPTKPSYSVSQDYLAQTETKSNLWTDTQAYNTAFVAGINSGLTEPQIQASLPTAAERNAFTGPSVYAPQTNFKMYNVQKWNLEVQKSFGHSDVISINYLGNHGTHKPYTNAALNAFSTSGAIAGLPTAIPDTRFGPVYYYVSGGSNNYNGVIASYTHKFRQNGIFTAGYTYGKILDNGANGFSTSTSTGTVDIGAPPDPYHPNEFYGPATTDERHNLVIDYVYKVPFHNIFYGGWQVSGSAFAFSGLPFTVIDTSTSSSINSYKTGNYGASLIATFRGGYKTRCNYGADVCLNSSEFGPATSVGLNGPRNAWTGPAYVSTDFALTKVIPLHWEGGVFSASAQAFNVLNHLNFARPTGSLSSPSFGKITSTINPSGIFSGVGGDDSPRILQLKATVTF